MRFSGSCWSCILLLTGHLGVTWATTSETKGAERPTSPVYEKPSLWDQVFAQKKLDTGCPVDHQLCSNYLGGGCCPKTRVCGTNACFATIESAITVLQPKITEPPLFKRKLGSKKWDVIHQDIQGRKRDATDCGTGNQACPASLSGGCCPNDLVCGMNSCTAASTLPATACGVAGYIPCGMAEGGGCCPQSYICQVDGCSPSAGVSSTLVCEADSYTCPSSLSGGCCKSGFACGVSACYATSISTFIFTETMTTTDADNFLHIVISTITTASTPTIPTDVASNTVLNGVIAQVTPTQTAVAKTSPTSSPTSSPSSSGLTKGQLGGIIGGAVALLIVLIIATFFIIRRLNKVVAVSTASQSRTRPSSGTKLPREPRPSASEMDTMSLDPMMMSPSEAFCSVRYPFHPSLARGSAHEVDGSSSSPPVFGSPFFPRSLPNQYPRGYNPVPTSESNSSSGYGRNASVEPTPPLGHNPNPGYFDISLNPDLRDQNLRFGHTPPSQRPSQHQRNLSDVSNQSEVSAGSSSVAELDAGRDGDRRSSFQRALHGFAMGKTSTRRKSSGTNTSPMSLMGASASRHPEWGPGSSPGAVGLGHIPEAGESRHDTGQGISEVFWTEPRRARGMATKVERKMMGHGVDFLRRSR